MKKLLMYSFVNDFATYTDPSERYIVYNYQNSDGPRYTKYSLTTARPSIYIVSTYPNKITVRVKNNDTVSAHLYLNIDEPTPEYIGNVESKQSVYYTFTNLSINTRYEFYAKAIGDTVINSFMSKEAYTIGETEYDNIMPMNEKFLND